LDDKKHGNGEFTWPDGKKYRVYYFYKRVNGLMENNTDKDIIAGLINLRDLENGSKEKELNGYNDYNKKYSVLL
jgi:hypothetical protein